MTSPSLVRPFDPSKPFYGFVMNFAAQLIGFKELLVRGVVGPPDYEGRLQKKLQAAPDWNADAEKQIREQIDKLAGPVQLASVQTGSHIEIEVDTLASEIVANYSEVSPYIMQAACHVLILAHEHCKNESYRNNDPLWEFLRHCRNAAGHGAHFNFLNDEPRRPAKWGALEILASMEGDPLFYRQDTQQGLISPGDVIELLWEIEDTYIPRFGRGFVHPVLESPTGILYLGDGRITWVS